MSGINSENSANASKSEPIAIPTSKKAQTAPAPDSDGYYVGSLAGSNKLAESERSASLLERFAAQRAQEEANKNNKSP